MFLPFFLGGSPPTDGRTTPLRLDVSIQLGWNKESESNYMAVNEELEGSFQAPLRPPTFASRQSIVLVSMECSLLIMFQFTVPACKGEVMVVRWCTCRLSLRVARDARFDKMWKWMRRGYTRRK